MNWSKKAWTHCIDIIHNIEQCSFVEELSNGSLPIEKFIFYIEQDNIYLNNFSTRLQLAHQQITNPTAKNFLKTCMDNTLELEQGLHTYIAQTFNTSFNKHAQLLPANIHYNQQTQQLISENKLHLTLASLLPCYWVYQHIGKRIFHKTINNNPFASWISVYGDIAFETEANTFRNICDEIAINCNTEQQNIMTHKFQIFTQLELELWDNSYTLTTYNNEI